MGVFLAKRLTVAPLLAEAPCLMGSSLRVLRHGLVRLEEWFDLVVPAEEEDFERTASSLALVVLYIINSFGVAAPICVGEPSCERVPLPCIINCILESDCTLNLVDESLFESSIALRCLKLFLDLEFIN